jgi:hypothetical protein
MLIFICILKESNERILDLVYLDEFRNFSLFIHPIVCTIVLTSDLQIVFMSIKRGLMTKFVA